MKKKKKYLYIKAVYNSWIEKTIDNKTIYCYECAIICNNDWIDNHTFKVYNYTQFMNEIKNFVLDSYRLTLKDVNTITVNDICLSNNKTL